uniref:Uncharacterized protein n=1 Tax=Panagrolaimus sp. ES5 TaxID=591445 RepID=A0AC34GSY3_9BILA
MPIANVPTIDISPLFGSNIDEKFTVAKQIDAACRDTGFFFAKNHGVKILNDFFNTVDHFHQNITNDEKWEMAISAYKPENTEHVLTGFYLPKKDVKTVQSFYIQNPNFNPGHSLIQAKTPLHEINVWPNPNKYPHFREMVEKFYCEGFKVSEALLHVANLQVETPNGYQDIEASDDSFLVNGGKFLELISSGYYKAPLHRVKYVNSERLSLPFFVHLAYDSKVEAASPEDTDKSDGEKKTYQYGTFFQNERLELIRKNGQT